ncbi:MAG: hypothetical protein KAX25_05175 [Dehalococcoidia bacterium]|nr:hypothetical protein [Chloroflexota bacterium]MCK4222245.1 hypothetical protein [Dehalococcoidia bacterium]MCK4580615.1 hypothetical protein [Dehalococcoidia bacterium]
MSKEKGRLVNKKALAVASILSLCLVSILAPDAVVVCGDGELPLDATVAVVEPGMGSYGESVVGSHRVVLPQHALDEPDSRGAWVFRRGWISLELEDVVTDCNRVGLWVRKIGWGFPAFRVYVSADGAVWTHVGSGTCRSRSYMQYDFNAAFGDVEYVKVERRGSGRWVALLLDAVWAKGGDADEVVEKEGIPD